MPDTGEVAHTLVSVSADVSPIAYVVFEKCFAVLIAALFTALGTSVHYLWAHAKDLQGVRCWVRRLALQNVPAALRAEPFAACARVERAVSQREACLAGSYGVLVCLCLLVLGCEVKLIAGGRDLFSDVLLTECTLFALLTLLLGGAVVFDAIRFGLPDREADERVVAMLDEQFKRAFAAPALASAEPRPSTASQPLAGAPLGAAARGGDTTEPFATTGTMLKIGNGALAELVNYSPEPFRPIVQSRMRACLNSFKPKVFEHERDCVEHLSVALELARTSQEYRRVDILAVCVDKTMGADYVDRYWQKNREAARAGIYISRVFAYDRGSYDAMAKVAQEQSNAGVNAYLIGREQLSAFLRSTISLTCLASRWCAVSTRSTKSCCMPGLQSMCTRRLMNALY